MEIRLDKATFKALASSTRVEILKILSKRRHMQSEIAADLNLSTPTVKEHLDALEKAGLVERHEEGRKWKYYSLTKKGKGVLNPEEVKIWIVLVMLIFSVVGGVWTSLRTFTQPVMEAEAMAMRAPAMEAVDMAQKMAPEAQPTNTWLVVFIVAAGIFAVTLVYLLVKSAQYKKLLGKHLTKK